MARTPPLPPEDDEADMPDEEAPEGDEAAPEEEAPPEAAGPPQVIATISRNGDGSYMLYAGDEPEEGAEAAPEGAEGGDMGAEGGADQGQSFDSVGALLKGVLDLVKQADQGQSGEGSDEDNFQQGYAGEASGGGGGTAPAVPVPATGAQ